MSIPGIRSGEKIYLRWLDRKDDKGYRVLWITSGKTRDIYRETTIAINEKDIRKLIKELTKFLD